MQNHIHKIVEELKKDEIRSERQMKEVKRYVKDKLRLFSSPITERDRGCLEILEIVDRIIKETK